MFEENVKCCASLYYSYPPTNRKDTPVWRKEGKKLVCLLSTVKKNYFAAWIPMKQNLQEALASSVFAKQQSVRESKQDMKEESKGKKQKKKQIY